MIIIILLFIIVKKKEKDKKEAMGGSGGHSPDFTYRKVKYRKSGGKPPAPPIASHSLP